MRTSLNRRQALIMAGLAALATPAAAQTRIPMQVIKGKIFIDVTVNGQPAQAMVDTGAAYSGLDAVLAETLGIKPRGSKVRLRHVQGGSSGQWALGVSLKVGGAEAARAMLIADFGLLTATVLHPITVLLGADFLGQFVTEFDFDAGVLTLHPAQGFKAPLDATVLPLARPRGGAIDGVASPMTAPVVAEGHPLLALADTGSEAPLIITPSVARRMKLLTGRVVSTAPIGGFGGTSVGRITSLKTFSIGGEAFTDVPVQVTARSLGVEANLGLDVLSRFHLWMDLGRGWMWLKPRREQPPFKKNVLGFYGIADGDEAIRITFVASGSPAQAAGLRSGDVVTRLNGRSAGTAQLALADAAAGTRLTLTLQSGQTRELVLAPYY